jgi:hypothetical protein
MCDASCGAEWWRGAEQGISSAGCCSRCNSLFVPDSHAAGDGQTGRPSFAPLAEARGSAREAPCTPCSIHSGTSKDENMCLYFSAVLSVMTLRGMAHSGTSKEVNMIVGLRCLRGSPAAADEENDASCM